MKKKIRYLKFVLLNAMLFTGIQQGFAQSCSPFVVSTSGGFYSNSFAKLSFTTGEMTMVQTFSANGSILTQGFQQTEPFPEYVTLYENMPYSFAVYPNPGSGYFYMAIKSETSARAVAIVYDAVGKVVLEENLSLNTGLQIIPLQLSDFRDGLYLLEFITTDDVTGNKQRSFQKIQLIK